MRTQQLIDLLAHQAGPAPRAVVARRLLPAALLGLAASVLLAAQWFGLQPLAFWQAPEPWIKLGYSAALASLAAWFTARLARPLARLRRPRQAVAACVAAMAALALAWNGPWSAAAQAGGDWAAPWWGASWWQCPLSVLLLALPGLAALLLALRSLAPTRLREAGAAAGLLAGALGACGYALSCGETAPGFVLLWYSAGIGLGGVLGAWLGPRWLRW